VRSAQPASAAPAPGLSSNPQGAEWRLRPASSRPRALGSAAGRSREVPAATGGEAQKAAPQPASTSGYRPFLDGLRAVAILGVLVYHLDRAWLPGGYLGVDVFFVLSGYLITMLLLAEHRDRGRIDLPAFWSRRIRRLLPALLVLLVVMAVLIDQGGDRLAIGAARGDLLATLFYVANWHFITTGTNYFTQFLSVSPDRHTWSLAIEEQFYLFWPIVASIVLARLHRPALAVVAATAAAASALWMVVVFDPADPSRAYFGTDTRIFEILIGCLLAIALAGRWRDRVAAAGRRLAPLALLVIALAYVGLADDNALYYQGGAVVLCLCVATLIAGLEAGSRIDQLLSVRPMVVIGLVSYGMYLWHFPVIVFTNQWLGPTSTPANALFAVAVTFAVTAASYIIVETPIRRRGLLLGYKLTPARLARVVPVASGVVAAVIVTSTVSGVTNPNWSGGDDQQSIAVFTAPPPTASLVPFGPGQTVGAVGDSVMVSALTGLRAEASRRDWTFVSAAKQACPIGYAPLYALDGERSPYDCSDVEGLHDQLIATHPTFVLWHDLQSTLARKDASGNLLLPGSQGWKDSLYAEWTRVLERFLDAGIEVVVILPPLRSEQTAGCQGVASAARCLEIQNQDSVIRAATREWFASLGGRRGVYLIQIDDLLCPTGYPCPSRISGIEVRLTGYDQTHFTDAGSKWLAPRLLDRALAALNGEVSAAA
jgi:peptidoglycan/LPS O-acetylase OafA/YrhL